MDKLSDSELLSLSKQGNSEAFAELFKRHREGAFNVAKWATRLNSLDPEDLVSAAYLNIFEHLSKPDAPDISNFASYLRTVVRNIAISAVSKQVQEIELFEEELPIVEVDFALENKLLVQDAFLNLPVRWRKILWASEVQGIKPAEIAREFGISPNSASALLLRAKEGFRTSYIQAHLKSDAVSKKDCIAARKKLGNFVRRVASPRDMKAVQHHLDRCAECKLISNDLREVSVQLASFLPIVLLAGPSISELFSPSISTHLMSSFSFKLSTFTSKAALYSGGATLAIVGGITAGLIINPQNQKIETVSQDSAQIVTPSATYTKIPDPEIEDIPQEVPPVAGIHSESQIVDKSPQPLNTSFYIPEGAPGICIETWRELTTTANEMLMVVQRQVPNDSGAYWNISRANGALVGFSDADLVNDCAPWWQQML